MNRRNLWYLLGLAVALLVGRWWGGAGPSVPLLPGATPAFADGAVSVAEGATFVSTEEGNAYLWRRDGDRIVLVNHCMRTVDGPDGQATYVSLPGVERGS